MFLYKAGRGCHKKTGGGEMKTAQKRARTTTGRRRYSRKNTTSAKCVARFLQRTFYYLKADQFIRTSNQLLCETI